MIVLMGGFLLGIAVGTVINLITALINRKAAVRLIPWLCLYIAIHGAVLLARQESVNSFVMAEARKYPHWLSYLIVVGGMAILATIYWHFLLRGVAWLNDKTSEPAQSSPAHTITNNTAPPVKEPATTHKTKTGQHEEQHLGLSFRAFWAEPGNMPERSQVKNIWNGKPWDEHDYADVRLTITSTVDLALQDVDLDISVAKEDPKTGIAGIAQLTNVSGVEFHKPPFVPEPVLRVQGQDGKSHNLPIPGFSFLEEHRIVPDYRVFCPRLAQRDTIRLILATICLGQPGTPPSRLRITGSYVTESSAGRTTAQVNEVVVVSCPVTKLSEPEFFSGLSTHALLQGEPTHSKPANEWGTRSGL